MGAAPPASGSPDDRLRVVVAVPEDVVDDVVDVRGTAVTPRFVAGVVRYQGHSLTPPEIGTGSQKFHSRRVGPCPASPGHLGTCLAHGLCPPRAYRRRMQLLNGLLAVQVLAVLGAFLAEAVGTFAVAVLATFAQMTGSLLSGFVGTTIPDTTAEHRR